MDKGQRNKLGKPTRSVLQIPKAAQVQRDMFSALQMWSLALNGVPLR